VKERNFKCIERSFAVGDHAKGNFILVKLARKRSISHYAAEVMKDFHGYEYEISYYKESGEHQ
jgi:hypothetical protein